MNIASSPIDFNSMRGRPQEPKVLTKAQCSVACTAPRGYFNAVELDDNYAEKSDEDIAVCIQYLISEGYATCGETLESPEVRTEKLVLLLKKYGFTKYELKRIRLNDPSSACETQGWAQGKDDSDCWIDSFLFSVFTNDSLASILIKDMTDVYQEKEYSKVDTDVYMANSIFCINLYLNLLRERKALFTSSVISDIKGSVKWCMIWYMLKYFEKTLSTGEYNEAQSKVTLNTNRLTIESGGDPVLLSFFLSKVSSSFIADISRDGSYNTPDGIVEIIKQKYPAKQSRGKTIVISLVPEANLTNDNYFAKLRRLKFEGLTSHSLESINIGKKSGNNGHQTAYTLCNGTWRYYDNNKPTTTAPISNQMIGATLNPLFSNINNSTKLVLLIYKIFPKFGGFTQKKHRKQKNKSLRKRKNSY